jgi:hypothetical protein
VRLREADGARLVPSRRKTAPSNAAVTCRHKSWSHASRYRTRYVRLRTHCRTGTCGMT